MGGYVALSLAHQNPKLVNKIVTLGTKFDWNPSSTAKEVKLLNPSVISEKIPQFATHLEKEHAPLDWNKVVENTAKMMTGNFSWRRYWCWGK
ncbi:MAG: pimeloyl-ACP methyl ester carboxylesterase [Flavobacteriaceae bacterium]|jgi:pimeloyl-ACP methyl ester carboxylesterase